MPFAIYYRLCQGTWGIVEQRKTLDEALEVALSLAKRIPLSYFGVRKEKKTLPDGHRTSETPRYVVAGSAFVRTVKETPVSGALVDRAAEAPAVLLPANDIG